ncbi:MAG: hypothetical protein IJ740_09015 [Ruminococcus sp.]|nr:hypothetical protein [Ruminococcus sp.]
MTVKRTEGKAGKWIAIEKALPNTTDAVMIYIEFPNKESIVAFAKLKRDFWQVTALSENNDFLSRNGEPVDLSDDTVQDELNRFVRYWQRIERP